MSLVLLLFFLALCLVLWWRLTSKPANFPPGPPRTPFLGSVLQMKSPWSSKPNIFWGIVEFQKQYGKVFGIYLGNLRTVVLTDYEDIKAVLNREESASRPPVVAVDVRPGWEYAVESEPVLNKDRPPGVILSNGNYWRQQRRYVLKNLKDFGFGKSSMEDSLNEDVQKLLEHFKPQVGQPLSLNRMFNISILNALWNILVGEKLPLDDPKLHKTVELLDEFLRVAEGPTSALGAIVPFPALLNLSFVKKLLGNDKLIAIFKRITDMIQPAIEDHKSSLDENNMRDFVDLYLSEIKNTSDSGSSFHGSKGESNLCNVMIDLFLAGTETTSSSLVWAILFLLHHPECQDKIWSEIRAVIGQDRLPSLRDQDGMHYTNAFLHESFRFAALIPLSVFHFTFEEMRIRNLTIPKDTIIIPSVYHVMYDPETFPEPDKFKPERFLHNGAFVPHEHVIPFGIGKRSCLGKSLAEKEYFLFFTGFLQSFEILRAPGGKPLPKYGIADVPVAGLARTAPYYEVVLRLRS